MKEILNENIIPCVGWWTIIGMTGVSKEAIYARIKAGTFPRPDYRIRNQNAWCIKTIDQHFDSLYSKYDGFRSIDTVFAEYSGTPVFID